MFQQNIAAARLLYRVASVTVLLLCPAAACSRAPAPLCAIKVGVELPPGFALLQSRQSALRGASGLTVDGSGTLWTVPEDERKLLALSVTGSELGLQKRPVPLDGIDTAFETESVVAIGPRRFAIGTERRGERDVDAIFLVEVRERRAVVTRRIDLEYTAWGIRAEDNMGIEGLCHAGGRLVAALEPVIETGGQRYAPIGVLDPEGGRRRALRLRLTTDSGKLSGLSCAAGPGGAVRVTAIERHYGVARLLAFSIPPAPASFQASKPETLSPSLLLDLGELLHPLPNFEGIARRGDDLFVISDNQQRVTTGPVYLVRFTASPTRR